MPQLFNPIGPTNEFGLLQHQGAFDTSTVLGASFEDALATNPLTQLWRWNELAGERAGELQPQFEYHMGDADDAEPTNTPQRIFDRLAQRPIREPDVISEDQQNDLIKKQKLEKHLTPVEGETEEGLALRVKWKNEELLRKGILANSDGDVSTMFAQFGVGLFASLLDPLNVAVGFIPIIGAARYSQMLARQASWAGRAAVRTRVGAVEGLVGTAMIEPLVLAATEATQYDYDLYDSFANLAFGTVLGGAMHGTIGAIGDRMGGITQDAFAAQRISKAIDVIDEQSRRELIQVAVAQVMSGRRPVGLDTALRKSLEEGQGTARGPREDRDVIRDPAEVQFDDEPALGEGRAIRVTASDGDGVQMSFRNVADAEKKAQQLEEEGFTATVRSLGEDDHRIDLTVENNFVRKPDGEYLTFREEADAVNVASELLKTRAVRIVKVNDEFLIYDFGKLSPQQQKTGVALDEQQGITFEALSASGDEIQMPLEVPVVRSDINPEAQGPTIQEVAQQDVRDANSDNTLFGEMQERELAAEVDRIMENITEAADVPQIEAEIAELEAQIKVMEAEVLGTEATPAPKEVFARVSTPEEINATKFYHGTGTAIESSSELTPDLTKIGNLVGQGIYLTDKVSVSVGYAGARGKRTGQKNVYEVDLNTTKLLDLETSATDPSVRTFIEGAQKIVEDLGEPPIKIEGKTALDVYRNVMEELEGTNLDEAGDSLFDFITVPLLKEGFEGYTHIGGRLVGKEEHNVVVLFDPNNTWNVRNTDVSPVVGWNRVADDALEPKDRPIADPQARQDLDEATARLEKTRESQKAWEQAAVCVLGGLT